MTQAKIHYAYNEPRWGASYCTPNTKRTITTDDPQSVTCKRCKFWADPDAEDERHMRELKTRPWWDGLLCVNKRKEGHVQLMVGAVLGIIDSLIVLVTFGRILPSLHLSYLFHNLRKKAE